MSNCQNCKNCKNCINSSGLIDSENFFNNEKVDVSVIKVEMEKYKKFIESAATAATATVAESNSTTTEESNVAVAATSPTNVHLLD